METHPKHASGEQYERRGGVENEVQKIKLNFILLLYFGVTSYTPMSLCLLFMYLIHYR